jgi:hypothetical protein
MLNATGSDDSVLWWVLYTNEAIFHMNGHMNKKNCCIWGQK